MKYLATWRKKLAWLMFGQEGISHKHGLIDGARQVTPSHGGCMLGRKRLIEINDECPMTNDERMTKSK
jgi:hypothetical protein